ncbi:MAG: hypothetical protein H7263_07860 [Candidatus Sericytochromatia bacterium]|nr:hypothetical protein [Candidatus Sericytochromatia bacterium]
MKKTATFNFFDEINDFIQKNQRNQEIKIEFDDSTTAKDAIEAIGVPHTEVESIVVNDISVDFHYRLKDQDKVRVYSFSSKVIIEDKIPLRASIQNYKFIVDANVAKMAKYLRMLGFDTSYNFELPDKDIVALAEKEKRIILSRDIGLLKRKNATLGYFLRKTNIEEQVMEVLKRYDLTSQIKPLSICLECNGHINQVNKDSIIKKLNENVAKEYDEFFQCNNCKKIFWKGSHHDKMLNNIDKFVKDLEQSKI